MSSAGDIGGNGGMVLTVDMLRLVLGMVRERIKRGAWDASMYDRMGLDLPHTERASRERAILLELEGLIVSDLARVKRRRSR